MKTVSEALKYFANLIWAIGNSKREGQQCLIPVAYDDIEAITEYCIASETVYQNLHATHFDIHWKDKGKSVILRLYRGDSFGACLDLQFIEERIIKIA